MISPSSTNPKVTEQGDYIFRVCFIDPFQGEVMAKFAANTLKAKTAAIAAAPRLVSTGDTGAARSDAGLTAPSHGLYLVSVAY